jgi:broad specificity phosphatase PhoE
MKSSTRIILVRHGEVKGIETPRFRGSADLPLTERGLRQSELTRDHLLYLGVAAAIYSSPLRGCAQTAAIFGQSQAVAVNYASELNDIDHGLWRGQTHDDIRRSDPLGFDTWVANPEKTQFPGGESLQSAADRALVTLSVARTASVGSTILLVSYDSIIRLLLLHVLGLPLARYATLDVAPCGISVLLSQKASWRVRCINETSHLMRLG